MKNNTKKRVKKYNVKTMILGIIVTILLFIAFGRVGYWETHYNRDAEVIEIESDGTIVVEDGVGYLWAFDGEGFTVGDKVQMLMHTNGTNSVITDDTIIDVKLH